MLALIDFSTCICREGTDEDGVGDRADVPFSSWKTQPSPGELENASAGLISRGSGLCLFIRTLKSQPGGLPELHIDKKAISL